MLGLSRPILLYCIHGRPSVIGKWVGLHVGPIFLECQSSYLDQTLNLGFEGVALLNRVPRGSPVVCTCTTWERGLDKFFPGLLPPYGWTTMIVKGDAILPHKGIG